MHIKKAVITVAGLGTRMYPATKAVKKELFPIVDREGKIRPALWYIIQDALNGFIDEICLVIRREDEEVFRRAFSGDLPDCLKHKLEDYSFKQETSFLEEISHRLTYAYQDKQDGFGHAVYCAKDFVGKDPFVLLLGDHIYYSKTDVRDKKTFSCTDQLLEIFNQTQLTTIGVIPRHESVISRYGAIAGNPSSNNKKLYEVTEFKEKPDIDYGKKHLRIAGLPNDQYLCFFGIYAFQPEIMDILQEMIKDDIRDKGEIQLTGAMELYRQRTDKIYAYEINGVYYDIGNPQNYVEAIKAFSNQSNC